MVQGLVATLQQHAIDTTSFTLLFNTSEDSIYGLLVPAKEAVSQWQALRNIVDAMGYWPVLFGRADLWEFDAMATEHAWEGSTGTIVQMASAVDAVDWLQTRVAADPEAYECDDGTWPVDVQPSTTFTIPTRYATKESLPRVLVALVPTAIGWHVPAVLRYGSWGKGNRPEEHVRMFKRWNDLYGAEVIGMLPDLIEMYVPRPPIDRAQALQLSWEQFVYCRDIVYQGTQTLAALAALLLQGPAWFFWWD